MLKIEVLPVLMTIQARNKCAISIGRFDMRARMQEMCGRATCLSVGGQKTHVIGQLKNQWGLAALRTDINP